jgi:hypothetical protein
MAYSDYKDIFEYLLGGDESVNSFSDISAEDATVSQFPKRKGVFSLYPATTPKYSATNDDRSLETMARLLIPMADEESRNRFVSSFRGGTETRKLAESLASIGGDAATGEKKVGLGYIDFLLQSAQEVYQEKVQVVDVVGDNFVAYYFGAKPPIFQYSGVLLNSAQDDWRSAFTIIYNDIIRGTELARRKAVVTLSYDDMAVTGSIMGMSQLFSAEQQLASSFNFSMLVQRIDVQRVTGHIPTQLGSFPTFIKPSAFAVRQFDVPPKTIRATGTPGTSTVERKKEETVEEKPSIDLNTPQDDTYGGSTEASDPRTALDEALFGDQSRMEE